MKGRARNPFPRPNPEYREPQEKCGRCGSHDLGMTDFNGHPITVCNKCGFDSMDSDDFSPYSNVYEEDDEKEHH